MALHDIARHPRFQGRKESRKAGFFSPLLLLVLAIAALPLLLLHTITLPIGAMFFDTYVYIDAANRISDGQIPSLDFFAPVGALGYYLFRIVLSAFPNGHPLLIASWSVLLVSAPLMGLVLFDVQKRSRSVAWALLVPFLLFSLLPFNTGGDFFPYPGSDGFGIYNRQICQLMYVLAAALCFMRGPRRLAAAVGLTMLALLFVKVTGAVAGTVMCLAAFLAGRLPLRAALIAGLLFFGVIAALELSLGLVSAYAADILSLVEINEGGLIQRLLQAASLNFGAVFSAIVLALALLAFTGRAFLGAIGAVVRRPSLEALARIFDHPAIWLGAFTLAGLIFESQNTGSQAFIFFFPLVLMILIESRAMFGNTARFAVVALAGLAICLPLAVRVVERSARAYLGAFQNERLEATHLKTMAAVSARPFFFLRAERMNAAYVAHRDTFQDISENGELSSFLMFSDFDYQITWLQNVDRAISGVEAFEAQHGIRFKTIMNIDFTNPFPYLMDRSAPHAIAIGADPFRAVPPPNDRVKAAVADVDLALYPTCPVGITRLALFKLYQPLLDATHERVQITPCFEGFVRKALMAR
ncbi:hypothetical protein BTR14_01735 [Rhizobium rhizosphaerae]|uniref:Uncharacterized protein n=1 Tax=Xaviernesmea rhizosphaerae TaxID=1672749 RepID=A0ABX3PJE9_9HYPH|nr:hypothetical protein [Xaviernesmea rhizosphaerae]OQP88202.1 hypothetical protein BTR14_01735 [Xaviernesmea rhizosphaerae]